MKLWTYIEEVYVTEWLCESCNIAGVSTKGYEIHKDH
jgi:hypothetical protein